MPSLLAGWGALPTEGEPPARRLAYFVSGHGFGHATRASAVMAALLEREPRLHFHIFSDAPAWVFAESLPGSFTGHTARVDVGLVQASAWVPDLPATLQQLEAFLPFDPFLVRHWAAWLHQLQCELVLCDIAPLGLAVAQAAELPAVLIENFTWDWIYAGYLAEAPGLAASLEPLRAAFSLASRHLQTDPVCAPQPAATRLAPISRRARTTRPAIRAALGVDESARLVLISLGGTGGDWQLPTDLAALDGTLFAIPGAGRALQHQGQILRLPRDACYHPDLVQASDVVVAKAGYSTLAEAYQAGVPIGVVPRPGFRESAVVADFVRHEQLGVEIPLAEFQAGAWGGALQALLGGPLRPRPLVNGAEQAADLVLNCLARA